MIYHTQGKHANHYTTNAETDQPHSDLPNNK